MNELAEAATTNETLPPSGYDAIHLLVYGVKQTPNGAKPTTPGLIQLNACMDLLKQGLAKNVVIGGVNYGVAQGDTRISTVYADTLRKRLMDKGLGGINVIAEAEVTPDAQIESGSKDTGGEVDFLLSQAKANNWQNVLCVGYEPHVKRATKLYKSRGVSISDTDDEDVLKVKTESSNEILETKHPEFETRFEKSPYRKTEGNSFVKNEKLKVMIMDLVDRKGSIISWVAHHTPNDLKLKLNS